jgi:hypothetical protein
MIWRQREPTLKEILSDSIVTALMEADGVDPHELEAMLRKIGRTSEPVRQVRRGGAWSCRPGSSDRPSLPLGHHKPETGSNRIKFLTKA